MRPTRTPDAAERRASSPAFVSRVSPTVSSEPMLSSSAVSRRRDTRSDIPRSVARDAGGGRTTVTRCYHRG